MKKNYKIFCEAEEMICGGLLCIIVALAFATAVGRCVNHPLSWTVEVSQFFLSWLAFLGADMGLRYGRVLGVDLLTRRLAPKVQAVIKLLMDALILVMLLAFVKYGIDLCISNYMRSYQTVGISYSWATASLPVASVFMSVTMILEMWEQVRILCNGNDAAGKEEKV